MFPPTADQSIPPQDQTSVRSFKTILWVVSSLGLAFLALKSGTLAIAGMAIPDTWNRDFHILLGISTSASLAMIFWNSTPARGVLIGLRTVTVFLLFVPFGGIKSVETYLLTSLVIDCSFALKFVPALVMTVVAVAGSLVMQAGWSAYYFPVDVPTGIDEAAFGIWGIILGAFCLYMNRLQELHRRLGSESSRRRQVIEELIGANRGYLEYASVVEEETTDKERKRIITELHDIVGQSFTNILAITEMAAKHPPTREEMEDVFSVVTSQARSGLDETRAILYKLHTFKAMAPAGLKEFHRLVEVFSRSTGIQVDVNWSNLPWDLGRNLNLLVHKLIRESLVNSFRHGRARHISVHFRVEDQLLHIDVIDDGKGGASFEKGIGLSSLEEQVVRSSGTVLFSGGERGFSVHAELPLQADAPTLNGTKVPD